MYSTTVAKTHGPEYYQALLAQSEDEVVKPKRTPGTQYNIQCMRRKWERFCQEVLRNPEVKERLKEMSLRDLQVFFRWLLNNADIRKVQSLLNSIKSWAMMYRDDVGSSMEKELIWKINTYSRTTLTKDFGLDTTISPKESTNENDLYHLLKYLWTQDTHVYPMERQRIQQSLITLLSALTTVRPGALVESESYRGTDQALLYRDVVLRIVRDPEDSSQMVLLMEVTVKLWKGARETMKPWVTLYTHQRLRADEYLDFRVTFVFYEHDCLMFCPTLHMLSLAFTDDAFDSDDIQSIQDIYNHTIPDFKESTLIRWKDEWMLRPIFRRACSTTGGLVTSLVKALPYASYASQMSALGSGAGFRARLTTYAFRRGAAQVVNKIATPAERNQIMGHVNGYIFEKHYQNRVVGTDISAAFLKMPSRSSLLASVGHIGIDRDPRAPLHLNTEEQDAALEDQKYVELEDSIQQLRTGTYKGCRLPTCNTITNEAQMKRLKALQASQRSLRKTLLNKAVKEKRRRFFNRIDNDDIRQTKAGVPVIYNPSLPVYALAARANLASILVRVVSDDTIASQRDRRKEALQNLIDLCHIREPHHMNPASRASNGATAQIEDNTSGLKEVQKDVRDLRDAFENMELVPLVLPSTMCLFCLGDAELAFEARTASFSRVDSLRRHINDLHLSHYDPEVPLMCPHPSCDTSLQGVNRFKNHAATVHNVFLSK